MTAIRLVAADDHGLFRAGIRSLLAAWPDLAVVGEAGDGREALRLVDRLRPDVVLLDIALPELNGIEVAGRLARDYPSVRVAILSMHTSVEYVVRAFRAGVAGYVVKDATVGELEVAIRAVVRGERYLSPVVSQPVVSGYLARVGPDPARGLTDRQREVLQLIAEGHGTRAIAVKLGLSVKTVETHRAQIMERLGVRGVAGLVRHAVRTGIVSAES